MGKVTALPAVRITVSGDPLPPGALQAAAEVRVQQSLSEPTLCEIVWVFGEDGHPPEFSPGQTLELHLDDKVLFAGDLTAVEYLHGAAGTREVRIRAYDAVHRLRKRQTVRSYLDVSLKELASELTKDDGLTVVNAGANPVFRHIVQARESDFDLLAGVLARSGMYFWLDGSDLRLIDLASSGPALPLKLGDNLIRAEFELNADTACSTVRADAWDPASISARRAEAGSSDVGRTASASVAPADVHGGAARSLLNHLAEDDAQAQRAAQAELDRRVSRTVVFVGCAEGDVRLRPGARVDVGEVGGSFNGIYTLTQARHRIDGAGGFVSELSTEPPPNRRPSTGASVTVGVVTQVEDPERRGRIRVKLPTYNDSESGWLPVVLPGVGQDKGIVATPNIDDTVLLLSPEGDPSQALVIGGLPGRGGQVDAGVSDGQVRRFFIKTASGLSLSFDDAAKTIRLQDASENRLELSPTGVLLHASTDLRIEAPGRSIKILADTVDFERG